MPPLADAGPAPVSIIGVSALTGEGVAGLIGHLKECAGLAQGGTALISARARHVEALSRVDGHLSEARRQLAERRHPELVAEELRQAQHALGEIVGVEDSEELLGRIFASFCIGK